MIDRTKKLNRGTKRRNRSDRGNHEVMGRKEEEE
jgi:hypothetical protein